MKPVTLYKNDLDWKMFLDDKGRLCVNEYPVFPSIEVAKQHGWTVLEAPEYLTRWIDHFWWCRCCHCIPAFLEDEILTTCEKCGRPMILMHKGELPCVLEGPGDQDTEARIRCPYHGYNDSPERMRRNRHDPREYLRTRSARRIVQAAYSNYPRVFIDNNL